mmetsp:Transcript_19493/g.29093  ORF Transcript_19493/g.29093 Transcript_19493/m.29093 type:complete len:812 (+) Transcript_19493:654-3089(+)
MKDYAKSMGIIVSVTGARTPQQNPNAERSHRSLMDIVKSITKHAGFQANLCHYAVEHSVWIWNRTARAPLYVKTPLEAFNTRRPDLSRIIQYGSCGHAHVDKDDRVPGGLSDRGERCRFIGFGNKKGVYRVLMRNGGIHLRSSVIWYDGIFDFDEVDKLRQSNAMGATPPVLQPHLRQRYRVDPIQADQQRVLSRPPVPVDAKRAPLLQVQPSPSEAKSEEVKVRRSDRQTHRPRNLTYHRYYGRLSQDLQSAFVDRDELQLAAIEEVFEKAVCDSVDADVEEVKYPRTPKNYKDLFSHPERESWEKEMRDELLQCDKLDTFEVVEQSQAMSLIGFLWVFNRKLDVNLKEKRKRARLVARGDQQEYGVNYSQTCAPTIKLTTMRLLLIIALMWNLLVTSVDISKAFLYGILKDLVYCRFPPGHRMSERLRKYDPRKYCLRLKRSVYGLCQASKAFWTMSSTVLRKLGLLQSKADPCLFYDVRGEDKLIAAVWTDDLLIFCNCDEKREKLISGLNDEFMLRDEGEVHQFLNLDIKRANSNCFVMSQEHHVMSILRKYGMENCNKSRVPMSVAFDGNDHKGSSPVDQKLYGSVVGALMYLMVCTRPDVSYAVSVLSRYLAKPYEVHLNAAKKVLRYLKGTKDKCLRLTGYSDNSKKCVLTGYADASHGDCRATRRSTGGHYWQLSGSTYMWSCKRQGFVSASTYEAETGEIFLAMRNAVWSYQILHELSVKCERPILIYSDNLGAVTSMSTEKISHRNKTTAIHYHGIKERIVTGEYKIVHVAGAENPADVLTKALDSAKYERFCRKIMGQME